MINAPPLAENTAVGYGPTRDTLAPLFGQFERGKSFVALGSTRPKTGATHTKHHAGRFHCRRALQQRSHINQRC